MNDVEFDCGDDGVGIIRLCRPKQHNAITTAMRQTLIDLLEGDEVRDLSALIIFGEGASFSAGVDIKEMATNTGVDDYHKITRLFLAFRRLRPVVICAVRGRALGLGCGIAMSGDIVIAGEDIEIACPEIEYGLVAGAVAVRLKELVSQRCAFDLLVTGRAVGAAEALRTGLVTGVVAPDQVLERAYELAYSIASRSKLSVHTTKLFFYESVGAPFEHAIYSAERVLTQMRLSDGAINGVGGFGVK